MGDTLLHLPPMCMRTSDPLEAAFLGYCQHSSNRDAVKHILLIGYHIVREGSQITSKHTSDVIRTKLGNADADLDHVSMGIADAVYRRFDDKVLSRLEQVYANETTMLREQLRRAEMNLQTNNTHLQLQIRTDVEQETRADLLRLTQENARLQKMYDDVKLVLEQRIGAIYDRRIAELQTSLLDTEAALNAIRKSNSGKGVMGENVLAEYMRTHFTDCEVVDTSTVPHACDMWIRKNDGCFIAVESKYKECVRNSDVDKFTQDINHLAHAYSACVVGGLFVSIKTRNIPGKGDIHIEYVGDKPVMYVGFSHENEINSSTSFPFLFKCASLLFQLGRYNAITASKTNQNARLNGLLRSAQSIRRHIATTKTSQRKIMESLTGLDKDVTNIFDEINDMLKIVTPVSSRVVMDDGEW